MAKDSNQGVGEEIQVAISKTEAFIEKYQKQILYVVGAIVFIILAVVLYNRYYLAPQEAEAQAQIAKSERYFATDSFAIALNGNLDSKGFKRIADEYSITKSSNIAKAYAGVCCYKLGDYQKAVDYLKDFDGNGSVNVGPVITGLIGDAYVELKNYDKALDYYKKAYETKNKIFSPIFMKKAAIVYETKGESDKALDLYTKIRDVYPTSNEASDIEKYIEHIHLNKK